MGRTDIISGIGTTLRKADKIDEYNQIMDLQSTMFEMQGEILKLSEENKKLKQDLETKGKISLKNNFYYIENDGPFCTRCQDVDKKLVRAHPTGENYAKCPECETYLNFTGRESNETIIQPDYSDIL